jgi:hypothetical protein
VEVSGLVSIEALRVTSWFLTPVQTASRGSGCAIPPEGSPDNSIVDPVQPSLKRSFRELEVIRRVRHMTTRVSLYLNGADSQSCNHLEVEDANSNGYDSTSEMVSPQHSKDSEVPRPEIGYDTQSFDDHETEPIQDQVSPVHAFRARRLA